jgi:hypothetical protein
MSTKPSQIKEQFFENIFVFSKHLEEFRQPSEPHVNKQTDPTSAQQN